MKTAYTSEFKAQILAMIAAGRDAKEVAKEYGIAPVTLSNWRRASDDPKVKPGKTSAEVEIKELRARVRQLEMERDILKKAVAIISKQ